MGIAFSNISRYDYYSHDDIGRLSPLFHLSLTGISSLSHCIFLQKILILG